MKKYNNTLKIIGQILFVIIFLSTSSAKSLDKLNKAESISDYFSGIIHLNNDQYEDSYKFLKKLNGLEAYHVNYSVKYLYSLINSGNFKDAVKYSKKLENQDLDILESDLILGIFYLKNSDKDLANKYFQKAKNRNSSFILNNYISNSLYNWSKDSNLNQALSDLNKLDGRFENIKKIQEVFINCFFDSPNTNILFEQITSDKNTNFSRYNYFYAARLVSDGKLSKAKETIKSALKRYPRNLILNQYDIDLNENKNVLIFNCKKKEHVIAEILYITANALSSQAIYPLSNCYKIYSKVLKLHSYLLFV